MTDDVEDAVQSMTRCDWQPPLDAVQRKGCLQRICSGGCVVCILS